MAGQKHKVYGLIHVKIRGWDVNKIAWQQVNYLSPNARTLIIFSNGLFYWQRKLLHQNQENEALAILSYSALDYCNRLQS